MRHLHHRLICMLAIAAVIGLLSAEVYAILQISAIIQFTWFLWTLMSI